MGGTGEGGAAFGRMVAGGSSAGAGALVRGRLFRPPLEGQRPAGRWYAVGDPWLLLAAGALLALGVVMVLDVSYFYAQEHFGDPYHFIRKHLLSVAIGLAALVVASRLPAAAYRRAVFPVLLLAVAALSAVLLPQVGISRGGARRWLALGPVLFQPSEAAKVALVLYLADSLARKGDELTHVLRGLLPPLLVGGVMAGLVFVEPDFGTAVLLAVVMVAMLFVGGARTRHLLAVGLAVAALAVVAVKAAPYRVRRMPAYLHPWRDPQRTGFQLVQSLIAFGSGGVLGVGLGESRQKMFYLPAAHTDFIFSVIGEELGLMGALIVIGLFALIAVRGFRIALRQLDTFGELLAFGLTVLLTLQALVNMGVVLGLLPTKGLALPLVSYGGSAMIAALGSIGVLLALSRETG